MPRWNAGLDAFWLHPMADKLGRTRFGSTPIMFMVKIWLDAILAPTRLKVHGTKLVDALWLHPVHGKFDMDANRLHI